MQNSNQPDPHISKGAEEFKMYFGNLSNSLPLDQEIGSPLALYTVPELIYRESSDVV